MTKKTKYIMANWKMYLSVNESIILAKKLKKNLIKNTNIDCVIFPSALAYSSVKKVIGKSKIKIGAQNVYWIDKGGYTGEISAKMYSDQKSQYALVGHSERRHKFGETNSDVRKKMESLLENNIIPVLCVGETEIQRKSKQTNKIIKNQLEKAYNNIKWRTKIPLIIAYEPVWAIGTGKTCSLEDAEYQSKEIRNIMKQIFKKTVKILYGGSVNENNAKEFLNSKQIDGVLVGGASTRLKSFVGITLAI